MSPNLQCCLVCDKTNWSAIDKTQSWYFANYLAAAKTIMRFIASKTIIMSIQSNIGTENNNQSIFKFIVQIEAKRIKTAYKSVWKLWPINCLKSMISDDCLYPGENENY